MAWRREQLRQSIKITKKLERLPYLCREREEQLLKHLAGEPNKKEASTPVVNEIFLVEEESSQEKRWRDRKWGSWKQSQNHRGAWQDIAAASEIAPNEARVILQALGKTRLPKWRVAVKILSSSKTMRIAERVTVQ